MTLLDVAHILAWIIGWAVIATCAGGLLVAAATFVVGKVRYLLRRRRPVDLDARLGPPPTSHVTVRPVRDEQERS